MDERSEVRGRLAVLLVIAALALVSVASLLYARAPVQDAATLPQPGGIVPDDAAPVIFGAVGDFDNKAPDYVDMVALAKRLGNRGGMFLLAVGDLGYTSDEQTWCGAIKGAFNNTLVVAGNHDTTESGPGDINNDVVYCPFNIDATLVAGPTYGYGKSYYFDYPKTNPLVRVIMITAGTSGTQVSGQSYAKGGAEYNWVVDAVTGGRNAGIPWVVVGLHKMCITVGAKTSCEMGQAIFDKVIDLKVDLILQGHDHTYQRSKQLALSANCTTVPAAGNFDADCVVAQGTQFTKGNGSIVVINGAGGRDLYSVKIDGSDKEIGYFDAVMGNNVNTEGKSNGHGTIVVSLNATTLTGTTNFCPLGTGDATTGECPSKVPTTFFDNFSISSIATPPPPLTADFSFSPSSPGAGQTVTFTASVQGGTPPYSYAWQFGDGATGSGSTATHVYANAGSYPANLTVTDGKSDTASASKTVVVTAPPPLSADFSFSPSSPGAGQTVTFPASASGGTPPYTYAWEFGDGATGTGATATHAYVNAGSYVVNLTVTDAKPSTASASKTVVVAAPPPLVADFSFTPSGPNAGDTVTFTASASGGVAPYTYAWEFGDGATGSGGTATHVYAAPGSYVANLTVTDATSATAQASKTVVVFSPPPPGSPTAAFTLSPTWPQTNAPVTFDASASSDPNASATLRVRWDWTNDGTFDTPWSTDRVATHSYAAGGTYIARLEVQDDAGLSDNATASVPVDGAAPSTSASLSGTAGQNGWYRSSVSVTLTAADDISGVASTWDRRDNASWNQGTSVTFTNDRVHELDYYSTDRSGRTESTQTVLVPIDQTRPATTHTIQGTQDLNGFYVISANVSLTATDALSGVAWILYRIDGAAWQTYTVTILVTGAGTHVVEFYTTDVAGNAETTQSISFTIAGSSSPPPGGPPVTTLSLAGTAGSNGWYLSAVTVTLVAVSPDGLSLVIHYRLDGGSWQMYTSPFPVTDGAHTLDYNATDAASQSEPMRTTAVFVDTQAPMTSAAQAGTHGRDHWFTSPVTVTLTAADAMSGVASTSYRLDGGAWQPYASPFTVGSGRHILEYRSADVAGQTEATVSTSIKVDTSPPKINVSPVSGVLTFSQVPVSWTETDDVAGVVENDVSVDDAAFVSLGTNLTTTLSLPDGTHVIRVRAIDDAGNEAVAEINVRVDTNPFSPTGPYGGVPLYFLVYVVAVLVVALVWRRHSRKKRERRQQALRRMKSRHL